jgi:hypothetical protein
MIKNDTTPATKKPRAKKAAPAEQIPDAPAELETMFSAKDLAARCETDAKVFRAFLRRHLSDHAKGARYEFDAKTADDLVAAYKAKPAKEVEAEVPMT